MRTVVITDLLGQLALQVGIGRGMIEGQPEADEGSIFLVVRTPRHKHFGDTDPRPCVPFQVVQLCAIGPLRKVRHQPLKLRYRDAYADRGGPRHIKGERDVTGRRIESLDVDRSQPPSSVSCAATPAPVHCSSPADRCSKQYHLPSRSPTAP